MDKGQRRPSRGVGSVSVVAQAGEVGWGGQITKQASEDGEGDGGILDSVVKESTVPISGVVCLEVKPERLLIATEIGPSRIVNGHVGFSTDIVGLRLVTVEHEHLRDFGIHTIGGVVAHGQILRIEELPHAEVSCSVGENVDGFDGRGVVGGPFNMNLNRQLRCCFNHAGDGVQPVHMPSKDGRALSVEPEVVRQVERDVGRSLIVSIQNTVVVVVPVRSEVCIFGVVKVKVGAGVVVVVIVDGVRPRGRVTWVGECFSVTEVIVVPRVGRVPIKAGRPQENFVLVVHPVFIIVFIDVVSNAVVVVVKRRGDAFKQLNSVGQSIAVPVVISPVDNAVVVVVPGGLFFAPETAGKEFLVNVQASVVIVVRVFAIWDSVVVVVNVVKCRLAEALGHDSTVPDRLVEAVVVGIGVVPVVVVVHTIISGEEIPVVLSCIVVKVEVTVHFEVVPNAIVIVVNIKPIEDGIVIVVQING